MKTDREIVCEANALAHKMLGLMHNGITVDKDFKFYREELKNTRLRGAWLRAVEIYEQITHSEVADAVAFVLQEGEVEPPQDSALVGRLKMLVATTMSCMDRDAVTEAIKQVQELERIHREAKAYDADLNAAEQAPDGDDYNSLFSIIGIPA